MVHRLSRLARRDDGVVAITSLLVVALVFIGLCALVVDLGVARDTRRQAQNAADASALAAGNALYLTGTASVTNAIAAAKTYATTNYGVTAANWTACSDASKLAIHPDSDCISFDSNTPTTIRVTVPVRQVMTPLAGIWGVTSVPVGASAQTQLVAPGGLAPCGLCVIGSGTHDLGGQEINVSGASVAINGTLTDTNSGEITVSGSGSTIRLQGAKPSGTQFSPTPLTNQPAIVDPLANLAMPDYSSLVAKTNSCTDGPGIYTVLRPCAGGMQAGLYVLTGSTTLTGDLVANGVTLYFVCSTSGAPRACATGETGGQLNMGDKHTLNFTAPTTGQANQGLSLVADRNNNGKFTITADGSQASGGTIYALNGRLGYSSSNSNGSLNGILFNSLIVVGDFSFPDNSLQSNQSRSSYIETGNVTVPSSGLHLSQ